MRPQGGRARLWQICCQDARLDGLSRAWTQYLRRLRVSGKMIAVAPVIAHRGASGEAPENTLAAVRLAAEQGATWVEVDTMVTRDGHAVIHHDDELGRCNDGRGWVLGRDLADLARLDAGSWFAPHHAGERIPTLDALIQTVLDLDLGLNLEIKATYGWEEPTVDATVAVLRRLWPADRPLIVSSFSERVLRHTAAALPSVALGYNVTAIPRNWDERLQTLGAASLHCHYQATLTPVVAAAIKRAGYGLLCFTVNRPVDARRVLGWGADGVFTDYPGRLLAENPA